MEYQKQRSTQEEEEALRAGVRKYGIGRWKDIQKDPQFAPLLTSRSNIDLKDKWQNLCVSTDKSKIPKVKPTTVGELSFATNTSAPLPTAEDDEVDDPSKSPPEGKATPGYNAMIFEALSAMKNSNGSDIGAIVGFIEQRHEVPRNLRRLLKSKLRRLVSQGKLDKVQCGYKIKYAVLGTKTPTPKQTDVRPRPQQNSRFSIPSDTVEEAASRAACLIADTEHKALIAAEAVKEALRVLKLAEEADCVVELWAAIADICSRCGAVTIS